MAYSTMGWGLYSKPLLPVAPEVNSQLVDAVYDGLLDAGLELCDQRVVEGSDKAPGKEEKTTKATTAESRLSLVPAFVLRWGRGPVGAMFFHVQMKGGVW